LHACELAERLDMRTIIVPRYAGVLSALGMLLADVVKDYSSSVLRPTDSISLTELRQRFRPLVEAGKHDLRREGFEANRQLIEPLLDVRYVGQSYELTVPFSNDFRNTFNQRHARSYGYSDPARHTEIVNLRVKATGVTNKPALPHLPVRRHHPRPRAVREGRFSGRLVRTNHYHWEELRPGARAVGPSVVTGAEATVVIPPRFAFRVDTFANLIIQRDHF